MHINPVRNIIFPDIQLDMGFFRIKPDHILILAGTMGLCSTSHVNGFQDIGFSLSIIAVQDVGTGAEIHM
jgi:hypothetical protein